MKYYIQRTDEGITGYAKWPMTNDPDLEERLSEDDSEFAAFIAEQEADPTKEEIVDETMNNKAIKAYILGVNDGTIVPGSNLSSSDLIAAIKSNM
ncbi:hypothetical protein KAR91_63905 [Candidatus Pacearchaeota archaeon]|nr:hypothetical protein [Candidatus Pacearchaeota archaeon]